MEMPPPGGIAWLDICADLDGSAAPPVRTGPLGLQIAPLRRGRAPLRFNGARLRGGRCVWSAATVSGAELFRPARSSSAAEGSLHILARVDASGSVFEPVAGCPQGTLCVLDPVAQVNERFVTNTHLFTLNVQAPGTGIEQDALAEMYGRPLALHRFQERLLRSAVGLLLADPKGLGTASSLAAVDRYLCGLAGLLLRTAQLRANVDGDQLASIRTRTESIIDEQAADPLLTPASIAAQLNVSLRQLYRAFAGLESPAARIRRRRMERASALLSSRIKPLPVERLAQECGFVSAEYFSRAFRREFGLSPRAYRSASKSGGTQH
jgi:AraC-like DNA-binding protein